MRTNVHAAPDHDLTLLTGREAGDLLTAALATAGGQPQHWRVEQVDHQPGISTTVSYRASVRWPGGAVTREILAATSGQLPEGAARLSDGHTEVGMWRFPFDPHLPALRDACDLERVEALIGVRPTRLRLRSHRPARRAVVEATTPTGRVFLKVVRPHQAAGLYERHQIAVAAGCPVPEPLAWLPEGLVALAGLSGRTLRTHLARPDAALPHANDVLALLDTLPQELADQSSSDSWGQKAPHYAGVLATILPSIGDRARTVADAVNHDVPEGPKVVVHGDFYESQIIVSHRQVRGLLDIDTAGTGERLDDLGCLLGHLSVLAQLWPASASVINAFGRELHGRCIRQHHPAALARRAAAVVLSLATGPHRVQEPDWQAATDHRVALAERWLDNQPIDIWTAR